MDAVRVIGAGRAGTSLARALSAAGWRVDGVLGRSDDLTHAATGVDLLVIATPDAAIAAVAASVEPMPTTLVTHLAGSLGPDVLVPHPRRAAIHPLVSLADVETGPAKLHGAWFAVAGDPAAAEVVEALRGRWRVVADDERAAYHAAACMASNHLVALLGQVERVAATAGVPLAAYLDLVRATVENVAALGPRAALTGPAARGDAATIARHLDAIAADERALYEILSDRCRRMAAQ